LLAKLQHDDVANLSLLSTSSVPCRPQMARRSDGLSARIATRPSLAGLESTLRRLVGTELPVLLVGGRGVGKETLAEALHAERRAREGRHFIVFEPGSHEPTEQAQVLFGRGGRGGLLEAAEGGTLFIDELLDLLPSVRNRLRRELERGCAAGAEIGDRPKVRLILGTRGGQEAGRVIESDLLEVLSTATIRIPSLDAKPADLSALVAHFWARSGRGEFPRDLHEAVRSRSWPGNLRELERFVTRWATLGPAQCRELAGPAAPVQNTDAIEAVLALELSYPEAKKRVAAEFDRRYVAHALRTSDGHVGRAAAASGIAGRYFRQIRARTRQIS
jgi:DNA-binding NtrC family response regulator